MSKAGGAANPSTFVAAFLIAIACLGPASAKCYGGYRDILKKAGMDDGCPDVDQTIKFIGRTKSNRGNVYNIYLIDYRTISLSPHGGQRILVFNRKLDFLGDYHLEAGHRVGIVGSSVILLDVPANHGNRIDLSGPRPPVEAWLDRDIVGLN